MREDDGKISGRRAAHLVVTGDVWREERLLRSAAVFNDLSAIGCLKNDVGLPLLKLLACLGLLLRSLEAGLWWAQMG